MAESDAQIVSKVLAGDTSAYSELVRRHQGRVIATARHLVGDRDAAEDLAQEAFIEAYRGLRGLRDASRFSHWLYGIVRYRCRKHLDRSGAAPLSLDSDFVPEPVADGPCDNETDLIARLDSLPYGAKEILTARYLHDMSYADIAQTLGTTVGNVRVRCLRAREALRAALSAASAQEVS